MSKQPEARGWKAIQEAEKSKGLSPEVKQLKAAYAKIHFDLFEANENGKKLLELWQEKHVYSPALPKSGETACDTALRHQAVADFVNTIRRQIEHARRGTYG